MNLGNAFKMAFKSLWASKMRTFLTMLGVIIGVLTIALLTTVTDGATGTIINSLKKESKLSMILVQKPTTVEFFNDTIMPIKEGENIGKFEYSVVLKNTSDVNSGAVKVPVGNAQYYKRPVATQATIYGVDKNYKDIRNLTLEGNWLEEANQIVVDREFIDTWFGKNVANENVIGQKVNLGGKQLIKISVPATDEQRAEVFYETINNILTMPLGTGEQTMSYSSNSLADFDLSVNYIDNTLIAYVEPNAFFSDDSLLSIIKNGLMTVMTPEEQQSVNLVEIADYFNTDSQIEYIIVGVAKEDNSAFSTTSSSSSDMKGSLDSMGEEFAALGEVMERGAKGIVYMVIDNENLSVLTNDASITDVKDVIINGAYLRYENEDEVASGNIKIMMAFMQKGYTIMTDIMPISMDSVATIVDEAMNILTIMLTVIASISLVVGGIGIMNIMLVAVSERTREIGIRKAIGAKTSSILTQFLVEALIVSVLGGLIGLALSFIGSLIIGNYIGITLIMPLWVIGLSLGFCLVIGVIFGMYPAIKASKLQPIDALRRD